MDSSSAQLHQQDIMSSSSQTLESMLVCTKSTQQEKKPRPAEQALKCPRCDSTNTKFCYYNNYSLSQPRYFCKSCRRYWTKGGTLRNVPVGGGCRKNKRSSSSSSSSSNSKRIHDHNHQAIATTSTTTTTPTLPLSYDSDISLAIARFQKQFQQQGFDDNNNNLSILGSSGTNHHHHHYNLDHILGNHGGFDHALKGGFLESSSAAASLYYGMMNNNNNENGGNLGIGIGINGGDEMGLPYEDLMPGAGVKQEGHESNNRVLWGFPWQFSSGGGGGGNEGNLGDLDSGRQSWNSSWHGLLNSPLM